MLFFAFLALGVLVLVLETTVLHLLPLWAGRPDLLFLLIVFLAVRFDVIRGALLALVFGLLMDLVSGIYLGLHPVAYLLVFVTAAIGGRTIPLDEKVYRIPLATLLYVIFVTTLFYVYIMIGDGNPSVWRPHQLAIQIAMMTLIAFPMFRFYDGFHALCLSRPRLKWGHGRRRDNRFRS